MQNRKCLPLVIGHYCNTNIHIIVFGANVFEGPLRKSGISANISVIIVLDLIESGPLFSKTLKVCLWDHIILCQSTDVNAFYLEHGSDFWKDKNCFVASQIRGE